MRTVVFCTICLLLAGVTVAQDSLNVSLVSTLYDEWDNTQDVVVRDSLAYITTRTSGLCIIDLRNPAAPYEVGRCTETLDAYVLDLQGEYAFVGDNQNRFWVIDISDPTTPYVTSYLDTPDRVMSVTVEAQLACASCDNGEILVIDISDPQSVTVLGSYQAGYTSLGMDLQDGLLYFTSLRTFNILDVQSDPANPVLLGSADQFGLLYAVVSRDNYVYVGSSSPGFHVYDVTDPSAPLEVGDENSGFVRAMAVSGTLAFVSGTSNGWLNIIDISDPADPTQIGQFASDDHIRAVSVEGESAYITTQENGLMIVDVSDPTEPVEAGQYGSVSQLRNVVLDGHFAYLIDFWDSFRIVDISDLSHPVTVGSCFLEYHGRSIALYEGYAYVPSRDGVAIISLHDPAHPEVVNLFGQIFPVSVEVEAGYTYVELGGNELRTYSLANPMYPSFLSMIETGDAAAIAFDAPYIYAACDPEGLEIYDMSDPEEPELVGTLPELTQARTVEIQGPYAYLSDDTLGLCVVDISDPTAPVLVSTTPSDHIINDLSVFDHYVCIANSFNGLRVLDVSDPVNPSETGYYNRGLASLGVALSNNYAFVTNTISFDVYNCFDAMDLGWIGVSLNTIEPLVVPRGGSFNFDVQLISYLPAAYRVDIWTWVELPNGNLYGPIELITRPMGPGTVITAGDISQSIPMIAPVGDYSYHLSAGQFYDIIAGTDEFPFEVTTAASSGSGSHDWTVTGFEALRGAEVATTGSTAMAASSLHLSAAQPNPFNSSTRLTLQLPQSGRVRVKVFDVLGREVATLLDGPLSVGTHSLTWDSANHASGLYFIQASTKDAGSSVQKVLLVR
ncbi:T9SS type A sorting domain-containing protein [bacterium]|nr:T9SS type A sorting domain-containing protein [bacterium]